MEALRVPEGLPEKEGKIYDLKLVEELTSHHREDFTGMYEEEKSDFLNHLKALSEGKNETEEIRIAAKRFLKEQEKFKK